MDAFIWIACPSGVASARYGHRPLSLSLVHSFRRAVAEASARQVAGDSATAPRPCAGGIVLLVASVARSGRVPPPRRNTDLLPEDHAGPCDEHLHGRLQHLATQESHGIQVRPGKPASEWTTRKGPALLYALTSVQSEERIEARTDCFQRQLVLQAAADGHSRVDGSRCAPSVLGRIGLPSAPTEPRVVLASRR